MPHILIEGPCHVEAYYSDFQPVSQQVDRCLMKTKDCYVNHSHKEVLVNVVVVENQRPQAFFISLLQRDEGVLVRLLPSTSPEKTDGVKKMLFFIGSQLKTQHIKCKFGTTNIPSFLPVDP